MSRVVSCGIMPLPEETREIRKEVSLTDNQRGIPVATVGINNSTNAALLAIRILGGGLPGLFEKVEEYAKSLEEEVMRKVGTLEEEGWEKYAERLKK